MPFDGSLTLDEVAVRAIDDTLAEVPSSAAALFLLDEDSGALALRFRRGGPPDAFTDVPDRVRGPLTRATTLFQPGESRAYLAVPLRARNRFCGLVAVLLTVEPRLTAKQRRRLAEIGDHAGEMIEAAQVSSRSERRSEQMQALYRAGILLTSRLDLETVLQRVADLARELLDARYAALGTTNDEGVIERFFTSGISDEERARIGALPQGKGLLGAIIHEKQMIRLADIHKDARSVGFPPHHPPMRTFIGMPIRLGDQVLGDLYVTEKRDGEFTPADEDLLTLLASQAAIAIENATLYEQVQRLAVFEERERIGMDLHDSVIQSIYAVGLGLEELSDHAGSEEPQALRTRIEHAIEQLNSVIRDIRSYIYNLRDGDRSALSARIGSLLHEIENEGGARVNFSIRADVADRLSPARGEALLQVLREALSNARRHAEARRVEVTLAEERGSAVLTIRDDGAGFEPNGAQPGMGLTNMRERAAASGGRLDIASKPGDGASVRLELPLTS